MSTPLLSILMLLTFEQNANIPDKMHLFYSKAFETLFHKHDAMKDQYDRSRKSNLQIDEFETLFSVFCLKTYVDEKTEFTESELRSNLRDALKYTEFNTDVPSLLFDLEESVCLIMREGSSFFFVHRSFQEYFTALFLAKANESIRNGFLEDVGVRYWDNVLPMLFDMASSQIESSWVIDSIDRYLDEVSPTEVKKIEPYIARWSGINAIKHGNQIYFNAFIPGKFHRFLQVINRFYRQTESRVGSIDLPGIDEFIRDNWNSLNCEKPIIHNLNSGDTVTVKNLTFDKVGANFAEKFGIKTVADHEYENIINVRNSIAISKDARDKFLKKVFSKN